MAALRPIALRFTLRAQKQLQAIQGYIHERNPSAARSIGQRIKRATEMLRYFPLADRQGTSPGTREWVVTGLPYIIVYELSEDNAVVVLGVFHGAQEKRGV